VFVNLSPLLLSENYHDVLFPDLIKGGVDICSKPKTITYSSVLYSHEVLKK